jgi:hypothetical protein
MNVRLYYKKHNEKLSKAYINNTFTKNSISETAADALVLCKVLPERTEACD